MALKPILESLDGVPDPLKTEYELIDGKYHLTVDLPENSPWKPIVKLTNALSQERGARSTAAGQLAEATRLRDAAIAERDTAKGALTEALARVQSGTGNEAFEQYKAAQEKRVEALEKTIQAETEKRTAAERKMRQSGFVEELRKEAAPFVSDAPGVLDDFIERKVFPHFKLDEQSGAYIPHDGATPIYSGKSDQAGKPMSPKEFIAERAIKDPTAAYMLRGNVGAGVNGNAGRTGAANGQFVIARGAPHAEYIRQKALADKAGQPLQVVDQSP